MTRRPRPARLGAAAAAAALVLGGCSALGGGDDGDGGGSAPGTPPPAGPSSRPAETSVETFERPAEGRDWVVLVDEPGDTERVAGELEAKGLAPTSVNAGVGMVTFRSTADDAGTSAEEVDGVGAAVTDREVGWTNPEEPEGPAGDEGDAVDDLPEPPDVPEGGDPLDGRLWGLEAVDARGAHEVTSGRREVRVGVIDTGVDARHPDLRPRLDTGLSRTFVTDMPDIDGECEHESCVDPVGEDGGGHGSHVAGTIAAAKNGVGVSGVAPDVTLVDLRAGQDSGFFFLGPSVNAITYAADQRLDVVNMSFYVDPWLYACEGGAEGDSPEQAKTQDVTIELVRRALERAHDAGVTMVASAGNSSQDLADPGTDETSPNFGGDARTRDLDPERCYDLPLEGPHVLGVSSVDEDRVLSGFSNYTSQPDGEDLEIAAPGGADGEGDGILSAAPRSLLRTQGQVDDEGRVTEDGARVGLTRDCPGDMSATDPDPDGVCGLYALAQGTSMAAPHVSGVAALVISAKGSRMAPDEVAETLGRTARDQGCPADGAGLPECVGDEARNGHVGEGVVDAAAAVR